MEILLQILSPASFQTALKVWTAIESLFYDQASSMLVNLKIQFFTTKKDNRTIPVYLQLLKSIADSLTALGHPVSDEDLVAQILASLPIEFESFVTTITSHPPLSKFLTLRFLLFIHEARLKQYHPNLDSTTHSALFANKGKNASNQKSYSQNLGSKGKQSNFKQNPQNRSTNSFNSQNRSNQDSSKQSSSDTRKPLPHTKRALCQICNKWNHTAL